MQNIITEYIKRKKQKIIVFGLLIILAAAGYFLYTLYQKKAVAESAKEEIVDEVENKFPAQCENGEWIEFPDYAEKGKALDYKENAGIKMTKDEEFTNEDGSVFLTTDRDYSLFFFVERDVRVEGVDISTDKKTEVYVKRIKCVGKEANKDIQAERQKLMRYISGNINAIAPEKAQNDDWQVATFYFYNDSDIYVEYESMSSVAEDVSYDGRLWLIRATKLERPVPVIETLAYIHEDAEDWEKNVVKIGEDLYSDADNMTVYEYEEEVKKWVLQ